MHWGSILAIQKINHNTNANVNKQNDIFQILSIVPINFNLASSPQHGVMCTCNPPKAMGDTGLPCLGMLDPLTTHLCSGRCGCPGHPTLSQRWENPPGGYSTPPGCRSQGAPMLAVDKLEAVPGSVQGEAQAQSPMPWGQSHRVTPVLPFSPLLLPTTDPCVLLLLLFNWLVLFVCLFVNQKSH